MDEGETIHCVLEADAAWGAPGANETGLHIEHCGTAAWNNSDWARADVQAMLKRSASLAASLAASYGIPIVWLSPAEVAAGKSGFTSHANITKAFPALRGTHTDPGKNFPVYPYLSLVRES